MEGLGLGLRLAHIHVEVEPLDEKDCMIQGEHVSTFMGHVGVDNF